MLSLLSKVRHEGFLASRRGAVLVEFALIVPFLVAMLLGMHEGTRLLRASQHMTNYVNSAAYDLASSVANVSPASLRGIVERVAIMAPEIIRPNESPWWGGAGGYLAVGITMVSMVPRDPVCQSNCNYRPRVAWPYGSLRRNCGDLGIVASGTQTSTATIPAGVLQSGGLAIVDVKTTYRYVFGNGTVPDKELSTSGYFPVRNWRNTNVSPVPLLNNPDGESLVCVLT
jgi:hypothetical protein